MFNYNSSNEAVQANSQERWVFSLTFWPSIPYVTFTWASFFHTYCIRNDIRGKNKFVVVNSHSKLFGLMCYKAKSQHDYAAQHWHPAGSCWPGSNPSEWLCQLLLLLDWADPSSHRASALWNCLFWRFSSFHASVLPLNSKFTIIKISVLHY